MQTIQSIIAIQDYIYQQVITPTKPICSTTKCITHLTFMPLTNEDQFNVSLLIVGQFDCKATVRLDLLFENILQQHLKIASLAFVQTSL